MLVRIQIASGGCERQASGLRSILRTRLARARNRSCSYIIHLRRILRRQLIERVALGFFDQCLADLVPHLFEPPATPAVIVAAQVETLAFNRHENVV